MDQTSKITFIGGGNMARSLIGGLIHNDYPANNINAYDINQAQLDTLKQQYAVNCSQDSNTLIAQSDCVVLAVKPQSMKQVVFELKPALLQNKPLIISIAAGIKEATISKWLGEPCAIVRCMPNTPALVQMGATGLFANQHTSTAQKDLANAILEAVGLTLWLDDENLMDAVTALSGSGPAYFFLILEALQAAGEKLGLSSKDAQTLSLQTALGAAKMAIESPESASTLKQQVTSKGGTTEQALQVFEDKGLMDTFEAALQAAHKRSEELANIMDAD